MLAATQTHDTTNNNRRRRLRHQRQPHCHMIIIVVSSWVSTGMNSTHPQFLLLLVFLSFQLFRTAAQEIWLRVNNQTRINSTLSMAHQFHSVSCGTSVPSHLRRIHLTWNKFFTSFTNPFLIVCLNVSDCFSLTTLTLPALCQFIRILLDNYSSRLLIIPLSTLLVKLINQQFMFCFTLLLAKPHLRSIHDVH